MHNIHEAIIIGCGIAGIGASNSLTQRGIQHIILESRDRIGGRIVTESLDGVQLDMGAMVVHHPHEDNAIKRIMDKIDWKYYNKRYDSKQIMTNSGEIDETIRQRGYVVYEEVLTSLEKFANQSEKDMSFAEAMSAFLQEKTSTEKEEVMALVRLLLRIHGNIEGAELSQISAKDLYVDDQTDVIPSNGYASLLSTIYNFHQRPTQLNCKVLSINYESSQFIQIQTTDKKYYARRVISSLPLGVLKKGSVKFSPPLPASKVESIGRMGVGVFNKVQVSFSEPFWDTSKQYILLVSDNERFYRMRTFLEGGRYILCAYVSGEASKWLSTLKDQEIVQQFVACLRRFYPKANIDPQGHFITRWHLDQHSLGSYAYFPANTATVDDVFELGKSIDGRLWFVGEHCSSEFTGCAHGAFRNGTEAGKAVAQSLNPSSQHK